MSNRSEIEEPRAIVSDMIGDEGRKLAQDLERARTLLRDGMTKIAGFVNVLQASAERAHQFAIATSDRNPASLDSELDKIRQEAAQAMLGLQMEDILGQLIEGTQRRVSAFSSMSAELATLVAERPSLAPDVERLEAELTNARREREQRVVAQESLDAGDAELF